MRRPYKIIELLKKEKNEDGTLLDFKGISSLRKINKM